jgi:leucyl aminopeptidase
MNLSLRSGSIADIETPLAVLGVFAEEDLPPIISELVTRDDFGGKWKKTLLFITGGERLKARKVILVGLGKRSEATAERLRRAYALAAIRAREAGVTAFAVALPDLDIDRNDLVRAVADGVSLASYRFDQFKGARATHRWSSWRRRCSGASSWRAI